MPVGTGLTPCLLRNRGVAAVPAEALFLGLPAIFLGLKPVLFPALRCRVPLPVVLETFLAHGFDLGWGENGLLLRLLVLRRGFRSGFTGRAGCLVLS